MHPSYEPDYQIKPACLPACLALPCRITPRYLVCSPGRVGIGEVGTVGQFFLLSFSFFPQWWVVCGPGSPMDCPQVFGVSWTGFKPYRTGLSLWLVGKWIYNLTTTQRTNQLRVQDATHTHFL